MNRIQRLLLISPLGCAVMVPAACAQSGTSAIIQSPNYTQALKAALVTAELG